MIITWHTTSIHVTVSNVLTSVRPSYTSPGGLTVLCFSFHPRRGNPIIPSPFRKFRQAPSFVVIPEIRSDGWAGRNVRWTIGRVKFFIVHPDPECWVEGGVRLATRARFNAITRKFHYVPQTNFSGNSARRGFPRVSEKTFSLFSSEKYIYLGFSKSVNAPAAMPIDRNKRPQKQYI